VSEGVIFLFAVTSRPGKTKPHTQF